MIELLWFSLGIFATMLGLWLIYKGNDLWKWLKFSVWYDYRYAEGYRKGVADGIKTERDWRDRS